MLHIAGARNPNPEKVWVPDWLGQLYEKLVMKAGPYALQ